jgi:phosphatidylinositol alpha-1,6-mannosyltransferase
MVMRSAERIVANSGFTRAQLLEHWSVSEDRVSVMSPGVDTGRFRPGRRDEQVRERLGWRDRTVILTVGALQKRKGQDAMIRALRAIRERCPDVLYAMIGEPWERPYLEGIVQQEAVSDLVQFRSAASDDDLEACYQQCDLFALPNRQIGWDVEGFGIVLLEAQACGVPVIAGASGGTVDTLRPGHTGEIVDTSLPGALADAVLSMLTDPDRRSSMGVQARQWVCSRFAWDVLAERAGALFKSGATARPA